MTTCPSCKYSVLSDALKCPNCGISFDETSGATAYLPTETDEQPAYGGDEKQPSIHSAESADGARFAAGTMLTDRYRIVSLLGRGGMGEVYKAEDLKLKQIVALKLLPEAVAIDGAALARFQNEVRITRQISHPNVCRVYDIGEADGMHFLSMEYIDGEDLSLLLRRIGRLPGDKANEIARQICAGLAAAHDNGVLHRDLKPANIMIDGRGKARVTDFGVAVVAKELLGREATAGTPAYMAPEQLRGEGFTQRSDIYSLGLVLYELFTGKRAHDSDNIIELLSLHGQVTPTNPSSHVKDIDPLVEKVILRCLEKDPAKRPASAILVAATLPGGDPLAAALAAGETPSPEMVAASGEKTGLRPAVAVGLLATIIAGLIIIAFLGNKVDWMAQVMHENSPDALGHIARDMITRLGYPDRPTDSASGIEPNIDYLQYLERNSQSVNRWNQFTKIRPAAIHFWYRESPRYLEVLFIGGRGRVSKDDPPQDTSGMVTVELDPLGRLIQFNAVPPQLDQSSDTPSPPDWAALFAAAGVDQSHFTPTGPQWTPLAICDTRAAWTGTYPDLPEIPLRIEAAAYRGKPVYFETIGPWKRPERMQAYQETTGNRIQTTVIICVIFALLLGAALLARHNFRQGRGDRRGAIRLAFFVFAANMLGWVFGASHVPTFAEVLVFIFLAVSQALLVAGLLWLLYLALEPYVRRRWPDTIVSWSRILSGSLRDSLVGRDLLIGVLFGIGRMLLSRLTELDFFWRGMAPGRLSLQDAWSGARYLVADGVLNNLVIALLTALLFFFLISLLRVFTRRQWLAAGIFILITFVLGVFGSSDPIIGAILNGLFGVLIITVFLRFGLVTAIASFFVAQILKSVPITTDFSAWYGGYTIFVLAGVLALAGWAFHTSLGGQKLFAVNLLDE